jgi:uncharacterized membrane protein
LIGFQLTHFVLVGYNRATVRPHSDALILESQPLSDQPQLKPRPTTFRPLEWITAGFAFLVLALFFLSPTSFPLGKMDTVAYAVCHRIPERSFFFGGQQLPLCARCSGTFLGVLLTLVTLTLAGRTRASRLPPARVLIVLGLFFLLWAFDGLNSYLTLYPGAPHLYEPQNWLRLTTGMLNGIALGTVVFSILQFALWHTPRPEPAVQGLGELAGLIALGALVIGMVLTENPRLLYPLALASTLGVVLMLTSANTIIVLVASRKENSAHYWRDAAWPLLVALALSLIIIMGIGAGRTILSDHLDMPF